MGIVTCSARYESRNAMPKNSTTIPMRAMVLPLVNQDHSDGVAEAADADARLGPAAGEATPSSSGALAIGAPDSGVAGVAAGDSIPERASAASSEATRCSSMT